MSLNLSLLTNDRRRRLFAVALCREIWDQITAKKCRDAVIVAERFADGEASVGELMAAHWGARSEAYWATDWATDRASYWAAERTAFWVRHAGLPTDRQSALLDDLAQRSIDVPITPDIARLADDAYHDRIEDGSLDPLTLSALADAVEDVSGPDEVIAHLRTRRKHYRGMWSLDLCRVPVEVE